jgi:hypothetical protein
MGRTHAGGHEIRNLVIFVATIASGYLAAPVVYIGNLQSALCRSLDAPNWLANLPVALFLATVPFPILATWMFPAARHLKPLLFGATATIGLAGLATAVVIATAPPSMAIWAVAVHAAVVGCAHGLRQTCNLELLGRCLAPRMRGYALAIAFGVGPFLAMLASLATQAVLDGWQPWPGAWTASATAAYAALYAATAVPVFLAGIAAVWAKVPDGGTEPPPQGFVASVVDGLGTFLRARTLGIAMACYILVYSSQSVSTTVTLFTTAATGQAVESLVGYQEALRFGAKTFTGVALGLLVAGRGPRAALVATAGLCLLGSLWPLAVSGRWFLLSFALLGAGELMGIHYPNFILSLAPRDSVRRTMAYTSALPAVVGVAPLVYGGLADAIKAVTGSEAAGFGASFALAATLAAVAIVLVWTRLPVVSPRRLAVESRGLVYDAAAAASDRQVAFFTSLERLASGRVIAGFQVGPGKHAATGTVGLAASDDGGRSWRGLPAELPTRLDGVPGSLGCAELVEVEPGRLLLFATWYDRSDPARPLFDPSTSGILHSRQLVAESADEGVTWSDWRTVPTGDLRGCSLTGPVARWADGTIAVAFESYREFDDPDPRHHAAWVVLSRDAGRTFSQPVRMARHPQDRVYYWDQRLCTSGPDGAFTALFWSHDLADKRDLPVHMLRGRITDGGVVGGQPVALPIQGQIAAPLELPDGRLVAFVVDRNRPCTMTLWSSPDGGTTWPADSRLVVHDHEENAAVSQGSDNVDFAAYWEDMGKWTFGHPALRLLPDGVVLAAWYAGTPGCMSIHCARIRV